MMLAIVAKNDFQCWQLDYNIVFPNAKAETEVYVKMAPEYEGFDDNGVSIVTSLLKSVYSRQQSPRFW